MGGNIPTTSRPGRRKTTVNDTLTEDVRKQAIDFIQQDPTKSYTPTTLKKALSGAGITLNPAQTTTLINQLKVLPGVSVSTEVKNNKPVQKIQATPKKNRSSS